MTQLSWCQRLLQEKKVHRPLCMQVLDRLEVWNVLGACCLAWVLFVHAEENIQSRQATRDGGGINMLASFSLERHLSYNRYVRGELRARPAHGRALLTRHHGPGTIAAFDAHLCIEGCEKSNRSVRHDHAGCAMCCRQ